MNMNFDILYKIFSYLDWKDLTNCRLVSKSFLDVADREEYWKKLYINHWGEPEENERLVDGNPIFWRDLFIAKYQSFGRYIHIYKRINIAWKTIKLVMLTFNHDAEKGLSRGISEAELNAFESKNNVFLPLDLRCSLRIHNGERKRTNYGMQTMPTVLGNIEFLDIRRTEFLLPLLWSDSLFCHFPVFPRKTSRDGLLPLSMSFRSHLTPAYRTIQLLSVDESRSGIPVGTIFYWVVKPNCDPINVGEGLTDENIMFDDYVKNAIADRVVLKDKMASSFVEWLEYLAERYLTNYTVASGHEMDHLFNGYNFKRQWVSHAEHITVRVGIRYVPEESDQNFFWCYRIIFEMSKQAPKSAACVLRKLFWTVTDARGTVDNFEEDDLFDEYAVLRPGKMRSYSSFIHVPTDSGSVTGYYIFRMIEGKQQVRVPCPEFQLQKLP